MKFKLRMASKEERRKSLILKSDFHARLAAREDKLIIEDKMEIARLEKSLKRLGGKAGKWARMKAKEIREQISELRSHIAQFRHNRRRNDRLVKCCKVDLAGRKPKWPTVRLSSPIGGWKPEGGAKGKITPGKEIINEAAKSYSEEAKKNYNRRYGVKGTVEVGDDGFLEVCLADAESNSRILHLHRYPSGKEAKWDCWVFEGNITRSMAMKETGARKFENAHNEKLPKRGPFE